MCTLTTTKNKNNTLKKITKNLKKEEFVFLRWNPFPFSSDFASNSLKFELLYTEWDPNVRVYLERALIYYDYCVV